MQKITTLITCVLMLYLTFQVSAQVASTLEDDHLLFNNPLLPSSTSYGYSLMNITGGGESSTSITPANLSMFFQSGENVTLSPLDLQLTGTTVSFSDTDSKLTPNSLTFHHFETLGSFNQRFTLSATLSPRQLLIGYDFDSPGGGVGFGNFMTFDANNNNIGLFLFPGSAPASDLHIKQSFASSTSGIRLEENTSTDYWTTYIDGTKDYNFSYNAILKARIQDTNGAYVQTSDIRLKKDITLIGNVLDRVLLLKPSSYFYKDNSNSDVKSWGFIAQEVETVFPELVSEQNGLKGLAYDNFSILSIKAIQELNAEVMNQKEMIEELQIQLTKREKIDKLLTKMEKMEAKIAELESQLKKCSKTTME